jgi:flagellar FliL protein
MAEQPAEETSSGKNNTKLFIIIGAAALVVVLIVVALLMFGGGKKEKGHGGEGGEAAVEQKAEGGHGGAAGEGGAGSLANVYTLEPFIVNIYDGQELRYLKVKVELEMASPSVKMLLDPRQAQIRDAILVLLTTKTLQDVQDLNGKNQLREEILTSMNKIVPPGKVTRVYFTDFVVQ